MCGIVGYLGKLDPKEVIVQGLKKLEYRGYDSAGLAIISDGQTKRVRSQGKLINLEEKLLSEKNCWSYWNWSHSLGDPWSAFRKKCPSSFC